MLFSLAVYLCCGAVAGVLAGLLGVGGGIVIVPMLVAIFPSQGVPPQYVQQFALGTSLASIMITSISSARAHNARGACIGTFSATSRRASCSAPLWAAWWQRTCPRCF